MLDRETQLGKGKPFEVIEKPQQEMQAQTVFENAIPKWEIQKRRARRIQGR